MGIPHLNRKKEFMSMKREAEIVEIWAAVTNTDLNSGEGFAKDHSYYLTKEEAQIGAKKIGPMGSDGEVEEVFAVRFDDGQYLLLARNRFVLPPDNIACIELTAIDVAGIKKLRQEELRSKALAKLTTDERHALGV